MFWCCCAQDEQGIPCDSSINGYADQFVALQEAIDQGGWLWNVPLGTTPVINPTGTLLIDYDPVMIGTPSNFFRCAQWSNLIRAFKYRLSGTWTAGPGVAFFGFRSGLGVNLTWDAPNAGQQSYAVTTGVRYTASIGWRDVIVVWRNGATFVVHEGPVFQQAATPEPNGPFAFDIGMDVARTDNGTWNIQAFKNNAAVGNPIAIPTPEHLGDSFSHGFSLQFDIVSASIDQFSYTPER